MSRAFTPAEDRIILDGRAAGLSWLAIGKQIGTTGKACQHRLTRGLQVPDPKPVQVGHSKDRRDYDQPSEEKKRDPMLAGADVSWQAITAGTLLDGRGVSVIALPVYCRDQVADVLGQQRQADPKRDCPEEGTHHLHRTAFENLPV